MSDGLCLLSAICRYGSTETFRQLTEDLFVDDDELELYDFVRGHFRRYSSFPTLQTIEQEVRADIPDADEPVAFYLDRVNRRRIFNCIREPFNDLREALSDRNVEDARDVVSGMNRAIHAMSPDNAVLSNDAVMQDVLREYDRNHAVGGHSGVATGWDSLDQETSGWQNGDLIVWVGRPSMGKTWLLLHQAHTAWMSGKSVLFVSMEMTLPQIGRRFASYCAGVDPDIVRRGQMSSSTERRFRHALGAMQNAQNLNWYAGGMSKRSEQIDILIQEMAPDIVYVDGIYLMQPANAHGRMGRYERAAYMVDELKTIAYQRNRPVVVTTQFGRDAGTGGDKGSLENIGYTDAFGTHASIVIGIRGGRLVLKPIPVDQEDTERDPRAARYKIMNPYRILETLKGREGESIKFAINYQFAPFSFGECPLSVAGDDQNNDAVQRGIEIPE